MMPHVIYRPAKPDEQDKLIDFANLVFSMAHRPHEFQTLLPKAYGNGRQTAAEHWLAVEPDGSIKGLTGVMPGRIRIGEEALNAGFVGTVSVHPRARGEGHMKKLMSMTLDAMQSRGMALALLGGQRQRYEYFGFTQGGIRHCWRVTATNLRHVLASAEAPRLTLREYTSADTHLMAACAALNDSRMLHAQRSEKDFPLIAQSWNGRLYLAEWNGIFEGYLIAAEDSVSELCINHWGLTPWILREWLTNQRLTEAELSTGDADPNLNRQLAGFAERHSATHYEMIRIFDFPRVIGALMRLKARLCPMADGTRSYLVDGQPLTVTVQNGQPTVTAESVPGARSLTAPQAQTLFLQPQGEWLAEHLPAGWAPLPLFLPAADGF